jgi:PAS domain-containing protein
LGNGWLKSVHEEDIVRLTRGWENATQHHAISLSEYRFVRPDGSIAWVIGQAIPEKNRENKIVGYIGTITNITAHKLAEEKIRINEMRLKRAQEIGKLGYWQHDINAYTVWASEEAKRIYGFPAIAGELPMETIAACIVDVAKVKRAYKELLKNNTPYNIEIQINPADGSPMKYISAVD